MTSITKEILIGEIQSLIKKYETFSKDENEANIRGALIDPFFNILGWDTTNPSEYDRENYVDIGFADVALKINGNSVIFLEAKRFGLVSSREANTIEVNLEGKRVLADWTEEERQVLNYAATVVDCKWAILTNFEKFRLFNAKTGEIIINIENPGQYIDYIDDLILLTRQNVEDGNLDILSERRERPEVDATFLELLKKWRLILANEIYSKCNLNLDQLNLYVQRILDRLVIIRYAEDNWILSKPDELKSAVYDPWKKSGYVNLSDYLISFFKYFDTYHNSKIFENDKFLDDLIRNISDDILGTIINELYFQSFRKFNSDILGSTYESYLSYKLRIEDNTVVLKLEREIIKEQGIVYTPPYIVEYIVENTLGKILEKFWIHIKELFDKKDYENAIIEFLKINEIKVLDPACGSGSFLIKAHDLFLDCYKKYSDEYLEAKNEFKKFILNGEKTTWEIIELEEKMKQPLKNHERRILKNNIYGVDLDETAAEIASVNLMLRAMKSKEKLPLILYENIKIGNSIFTGVDNTEELLEHSNEIKNLIQHRNEIKNTQDPKAKKEIEIKYEKLKKGIDDKFNNNLFQYSSDLEILKPFNFETEFPEVFYDYNGNLKENRGFDVIFGNPPWGAELEEYEKNFINDFYDSVEYQIETYVAFMERSFTLLKNKGYFGFITTSTWLTYHYFQKIRKLLITKTSFNETILIRYMAFEDVTAETAILTYRKMPPINEHKIKITAFQDKSEFSDMDFGEVDQSYWIDNYETGFNVLYWDKLDLVEKIFKNSKKLEKDNLVNIISGIVPYEAGKGNPKQTPSDVKNRIYDANYKAGPEYRQYLVGTNIKRFYIEPDPSKWIKFGDCLAAPRKSINFSDIKIIVRQTGDSIIGALDTEGFLNLKSVHNIVIKDKNIDYKFLLGILNSKLANFIYKYLVPEDGRPLAEVKGVKLAHLPIKVANKTLQKPVIDLVDQISTLNYQKYDLMNLFINSVINLNQNKKLQSLKYYIKSQNSSHYSINLTRTEQVNEEKSCIPRKYEVLENGNFLVLSAICSEGTKYDLLKLYFDDKTIRQFFYLAISISVKKPKRYRNEKNLIEALLNDVRIPKSVNNNKEDLKNINHLMNLLNHEYKKMIQQRYTNSPVKDLNLEKIMLKIDKLDEKLNKRIYDLYKLNNSDINVLEDTLQK